MVPPLPLWISLCNYRICLQEKGLLVVCSPLPFLETYLQSRAAHMALISGRELPALWELGERRAASFPESQSRFPESQPRISCVGLGPGEVEPACSQRLREPPSSESIPAAALPALVLLRGVEEAGCARGPWGKLQLLFGEPGENTRRERERQCHGPALLLSFLKRRGKNQ